MTTTDDLFLDVLTEINKRPWVRLKENYGTLRGNSPLRPGSDSNSFTIDQAPDGEWLYYDFRDDEGGNLWQLARKLGMQPQSYTGAAQETKTSYAGLSDFAARHGCEADAFEKAGWIEGTYQGRPALKFPTKGLQAGWRWRFIDGKKGAPVFKSEYGYVPCLYGFGHAVQEAQKQGVGTIVLCNGEASTIAGKSHGVPAFCRTSGEMRLTDAMVSEIENAWNGEIAICLDSDDKGREIAKEIQSQLSNSWICELNLSTGGDLADFVQLWGDESLNEIIARKPAYARIVTTTHESIKDVGELIAGTKVMPGKPLYFPFKSFHRFDGLAEILVPGKIVAIVAASAGGKTSFLECLADHWSREGEDGFWYGTEWTAQEMMFRRIQRYSQQVPVTFNQMMKHELYKFEAEAGVRVGDRRGIPLSHEQVTEARFVSKQVGAWPGQVGYFRPSPTIDTLLEDMTHQMRLKRKNGQETRYAIFDYVQLLATARENIVTNMYESIVDRIKAWCEQEHIVAIVASQVNKAAMFNGGLIEAADANYIRDIKFNLFFSMNRVKTGTDPNTGRPIYDQLAIINILKNSTGRTGKLKMATNFKKLSWFDPVGV